MAIWHLRADLGAPYSALLYERFLGRPFAGHRDSISELVGNTVENAIEDVMSRNGISFRKTRRAERLPGFDQAPDFVIPNEIRDGSAAELRPLLVVMFDLLRQPRTRLGNELGRHPRRSRRRASATISAAGKDSLSPRSKRAMRCCSYGCPNPRCYLQPFSAKQSRRLGRAWKLTPSTARPHLMDAQIPLDALRRGEDSRQQFEVDVTSIDALAAALAAFSNAARGRLIIGVDDRGEMRGLTRDDIARLNQLVSKRRLAVGSPADQSTDRQRRHRFT
jgi:hypothetical protein